MRSSSRATRLLLLVLAALSLAGGLVAAPAAAQEGAVGDAVVAFVDTGINPYHQVFRDNSPRAYQHPSTYIPGYPEDAIALDVTLTQTDWAKAVRADCELWKTVVPNQLYWFPGTKIVGAITTKPTLSPNCSGTTASGFIGLLDLNGHGTMVASRAAANAQWGACRQCRVVAIQYPNVASPANRAESTDPSIRAIEWGAANAGWIDAQSNSWGPIVPGWEPTGANGMFVSDPSLVKAVESVSLRQAAFWASGNGAAFRGGVLGHPTLATPHLTPSAISVGGHDSGYVQTWPGFPAHLVSDSCWSWAANHKHTTTAGEKVGGGTSAATPFVAGGAGQILVDARTILGDTRTGRRGEIMAEGPAGLVASGPLADGVFTFAEWKRVLYTTATPRPARQFEDGPPCSLTVLSDPTPVQWTSVPAGYPEFLHIGYGAVDRPSIELAGKVLRGEAAMPTRAATDQYFALDNEVRKASYSVFKGL